MNAWLRTWIPEARRALIVLAAATLAAVFVNALRPEPWPWWGAAASGVEITRADLARLRPTVIFIDTRPAPEYARGHAAGAVSWPAERGNENAALADTWLSPQDSVVIYAADAPGEAERRIRGWLLEEGFEAGRVKLLAGGWRELNGNPPTRKAED